VAGEAGVAGVAAGVSAEPLLMGDGVAVGVGEGWGVVPG
jgi:hypothetical protein